jgi:conflict system STAND superfamily ATPase
VAASAVTGYANRVPYVGCRPFCSDDDQLFFGRSVESHEIATLWQHSRVTVLSGSSGVGRTSLLQAGVIPMLGSARADVLPVGRVSLGTAFPLAALPEHNPHTLALLATWAPEEPPTRLSGLTVREFLRRRAARTDPYGKPVPLLAAIDQVEDLFAGPVHTDWQRRPFIDELVDALEAIPHLHLLACVRDDWVANFAAYGLMGGAASWSRFALRALSPDTAVQAVQAPLAGTGRWFAQEAAETMVADLRSGGPGEELSPDVEPSLLQAVCVSLWAALGENVREITSRQLSALGGVRGLLASFAERAIVTVTADQGLPVAELWSWLRQKFVTEVGTRGAVYEGATRTAGMPNAVVRALRDWHILTVVRRSGSRWYELQHDCLIEVIQQAGTEAPGAWRMPSRISAHDYLRAAELAMADGDLDLAEKHAAQALRGAEEGTSRRDIRMCADAESLLGNVAHSRGEHKQAEARYRIAASLFDTLQDAPAVAGLLAAVGKSLLAQGKRDEAVECMYAAVGRAPNDLTVQTELAWALWHAGQQQAAVAVLTGVLARDGNAAGALRARGEILADLGEAEAALRDLDRVQQSRRPSSAAARGLALAMLRREGAADPEIDDALSRAPDNGPVLLYAARVASLGRDPAVAADLARRAVRATAPAVPPHQRKQALALIDIVG